MSGHSWKMEENMYIQIRNPSICGSGGKAPGNRSQEDNCGQWSARKAWCSDDLMALFWTLPSLLPTSTHRHIRQMTA